MVIMDEMKRGTMSDGLKFALLAYAFYRGRHSTRPRFKRPRTAYNARQRQSNYTRSVELARKYVELARAAGFCGSLKEAAAGWVGQIREIGDSR